MRPRQRRGASRRGEPETTMTPEPPFTEAATSRFVQVRDGEALFDIQVNDCGAGAGTVVMLHGSGPGASCWANFNRNVGPVVEAGYRVLLVDCPGWGRSSPVVCTGSRSDLNARVVKGVLDALGIDRAHLVGNSMGAHSAVAFALAFPDRVGRLVLMGGGTGGPSQFVPMPTEGIKLIQALYRDPTIENLRRMMAAFVFDTGALTEAMLRERLDNMLARRDHLENFVKSLAANPRQFPDYGHRLGEVRARTLVVWGRDDRFVPFDVGLRLLWGLPDADLLLLGRCGHWAQWEHAEVFNETVLAFLRRP
jgi:2-hydroxy-6-oxonona-2,4-dienedioate hydrolase